ncbi:hypothetical protein [Kutzneria buriramensis]|uniref:Uncharacterized protein n=1 Tax=Kutzneria buriramensis TaxID=1045776 RepID=A0A3E0G8F7_9PSEU|nr:hypothetical protein [Kutzneria buriramensis]REH18252.1 hypothetical protein BCF44_1367 [Kutzneria buriramensis]
MSRALANPAATCREHQHLLDEVAHCTRDLSRFADDEPDHRRAREILTELADHCRSAAGVFTTDPTLADEPYDTGRYRAIDLLAELARQTRQMLRSACSDVRLDRWPRQDRWDEAEAIFTRAVHYATVIPQAVPRRDHATEAGSRRISRDRLAAHSRQLTTAADDIRDAVAAALRLPYPDPQALALVELADQLTQHAEDLAAHHMQQTNALGAACGLPGYAPEPSTR